MQPAIERAISGADLVEGEDGDTITLYVQGAEATQFKLARGLGERVLMECGLARVP